MSAGAASEQLIFTSTAFVMVGVLLLLATTVAEEHTSNLYGNASRDVSHPPNYLSGIASNETALRTLHEFSYPDAIDFNYERSLAGDIQNGSAYVPLDAGYVKGLMNELPS